MPEMYRRLKSQKTAEPWMSSPALPAAVGRAWTVGPSLSMRRTTQTTRAASCSSVRDPWGTCSLIDFPGKWVFSADSRNAFEIMLFKGSLIEQKGKLLLGPSACLSWFVLSALNIQLQFQLARPRLRVIRVPFSAGSSACIQWCDSCELCFCFCFLMSCYHSWCVWYFLSGSFVFQMQDRLGLHEASVFTLCCGFWTDCSSLSLPCPLYFCSRKLDRSLARLDLGEPKPLRRHRLKTRPLWGENEKNLHISTPNLIWYPASTSEDFPERPIGKWLQLHLSVCPLERFFFFSCSSVCLDLENVTVLNDLSKISNTGGNVAV